MWAKQKRAQERPKAATGLAHFTGEETGAESEAGSWGHGRLVAGQGARPMLPLGHCRLPRHMWNEGRRLSRYGGEGPG